MGRDAMTKEQISARFTEIVDDIAEQGWSLRKTLSAHNTSSSDFYEWLEADAEKKKRYACACEARADKLFDEILEIADKQGEDVVEVDGQVYTNHNVVNRSRLQVDARKWMLEKLNPKKYGNKVENTIVMEQPLFGSDE